MAHIIVGTRGSSLALTQCTKFVKEMELGNPDHTFELKIIKTCGDLDQTTSLSSFGLQGVFVKELENALFAGEIDCAVHSLKDVPHELPDGLEISVFSKRENPYDVLISNGVPFNELKPGSKVGTGSVRRRVMLKAIRNDLEYVDLRGNIETRIGKVSNGELDGVILAAAGINRLSKEKHVTQVFECNTMIPAIAQGVLGVETRVGDVHVTDAISTVNDSSVQLAMEIERGFMKAIGGGCKAPMAAYVQLKEGTICVAAMIANQDTGDLVRLDKEYIDVSSEDIVNDMVTYFEVECTKKGIPLPNELDDHQLLK